MGLLDSLNPISIVSDAAESLCDALLPKQLEFVGDLVGLGLDLDSGNWPKCLSDVQDLFKDLPQELAHLGTLNGSPGNGLISPSFLEPIPPPPYGAAAFSISPGSVPNLAPGLATAPSPSWLAPPLVAPSVRATSATPILPSPGGWIGSPTTPPWTPPAQPSPPSTTSLTADGFFALSDVDLMNAVRGGHLPEAVKNDPQQMRRLDARINDITQMNQLITNMLKALHDMNAQIIQNIRV